jgi:nitrous oxidase accessory protein
MKAVRGVAASLLLLASAGDATPPCRTVAPGESLGRLLAEAASGDAFCLAAGRWQGPLSLGAGVTLRGPREAVLAGGDTVVTLAGEGAALLDLTVEGSGTRFDRLDAAVSIRADRVRVEGLRIRGALFGIVADRAARLVIRGNEITGDASRPLGLRGDGIRLWEVRDSLVADNRLSHGRDLVAWYAPGNRFEGNRVEHGRYGLHFMYSHDNHVVGNGFVDDVVGVFVMYSRRVTVERNQLLRAGGAAGIGLGLKDGGDLRVRGNVFVGNTTGVYIDTSAGDRAEHNHFEANEFRFQGRALLFHGPAERNRFVANRFRDNRIDVEVDGRGDALAASFAGNEWDGYVGYDLDGDGVGDVPHRPRSLSHAWIARVPPLAFFRGTAALGIVEWLGQALPLFATGPLLVDPAPRLRLGELGVPRAD